MVENKKTGKPREGMISDLKEAIRKIKVKKEISDPKEGAGDKEEGGKREEIERGKKKESKREEKKENKIEKKKKKNEYVKMRRMAGDREWWRDWVPGTCS